jgi:hypothetical protein
LNGFRGIFLRAVQIGFAQKLFYAEGFSGKGAKTQSAAAFLRVFFSPLRRREKCFLSHVEILTLGTFFAMLSRFVRAFSQSRGIFAVELKRRERLQLPANPGMK